MHVLRPIWMSQATEKYSSQYTLSTVQWMSANSNDITLVIIIIYAHTFGVFKWQHSKLTPPFAGSFIAMLLIASPDRSTGQLKINISLPFRRQASQTKLPPITVLMCCWMNARSFVHDVSKSPVHFGLGKVRNTGNIDLTINSYQFLTSFQLMVTV